MTDGVNEEGIKASLLDRVGVELPPDMDENYDTLMLGKYGAELIANSARQPGESPDAYVARLLQLYPEPHQHAYILAFNAVYPAAEYGAIAVQAYRHGSTVTDPRIVGMYPSELNRDAVGIDSDGKNTYALRMSPAESAEIIRACNLAAAAIDGFGDRRLKKARLLLESIASGNTPPEGLQTPAEIKVSLGVSALRQLRKLFGEQITELGVDRALNQITLRSLGLSTDSTANVFREISRSISGPFDPLDLLAKVLFSLRLSLDDLNIYPEVGPSIFDAYRPDLETISTSTASGI
ncbi:hypothetical protein A2957_00825 [Candidatus Roizmanbacteria bacterium RIFCSPLOWO2_01_FULL_38_11]|uniref:Uncharacterized protein n=1 Tax=Candidatus Roizmanbacteria bacterium RIFCSPLOWO2_01_FULL_38_11 TaxID=1802060 RepID=A0A1F7IM67_9BACT|nr:MAG: hypothetical protein A2957_00825 [Candidatus Roizmanbacteria bacterium RIFCSPLOWO2_01_FULL_38_11]